MNLAALGTGVVIGFVYSWKLALLVIGFMPFIAIAGFIEMKVLQGTTNSSKEGLEQAGKVGKLTRLFAIVVRIFWKVHFVRFLDGYGSY